MLEFSMSNIIRVDKVVVRQGEQENPLSLVPRRLLHVSLFIGNEQMVYGIPQQNRRSRDRAGEFVTNRSGLEITLMFLKELTGTPFVSQGDNSGDIEEFRPQQCLGSRVVSISDRKSLHDFSGGRQGV
jgi:hypothetical protein